MFPSGQGQRPPHVGLSSRRDASTQSPPIVPVSGRVVAHQLWVIPSPRSKRINGMLDVRLIGIEAFISTAQLTQPWAPVSGVSRTQVRVVSSA